MFTMGLTHNKPSMSINSSFSKSDSRNRLKGALNFFPLKGIFSQLKALCLGKQLSVLDQLAYLPILNISLQANCS